LGGSKAPIFCLDYRLWASHLSRDKKKGLTVRPESVEVRAVKPFMVRQAYHERLNLNLSCVKLKAKNAMTKSVFIPVGALPVPITYRGSAAVLL
jgi:hypothetical protein